MTLQDLMDFLWDEAAQQTLTRQQVERTLLLAYEMGLEAGRLELARPVEEETTPKEN
jgi:hypothetical protein